MMNEQYKSEALAAVHETALGLSEAGVMDKMTMKMFDEMCLIPVMEMGTDFSAHIDSLRSRFKFPESPLTPRKELEGRGERLAFDETLGLGTSRFPLRPSDGGFKTASKETPTTISGGKKYEPRFVLRFSDYPL